MKKILLLGSGGQLGKKFSNELVGFKVTPITRKEFDLSKIKQLPSLFYSVRPDLVINCSAYTNVNKAEIEREQAFLLNARAPEKLAKLCAQNEVPLIHFSTDYVFSGKSFRYLTEEDPACPVNVYGESKLLGEKLVLEYCPKSLVLRLSSVYDYESGNFVTKILKAYREKEELKVVANQYMIPTSTQFIVDRVKPIVEKLLSGKFRQQDFGMYHLAEDKACSWYQFAKELVRQEHLKAALNIKSVKPILVSDLPPSYCKRPYFSVLDSTKFITRF